MPNACCRRTRATAKLARVSRPLPGPRRTFGRELRTRRCRSAAAAGAAANGVAQCGRSRTTTDESSLDRTLRDTSPATRNAPINESPRKLSYPRSHASAEFASDVDQVASLRSAGGACPRFAAGCAAHNARDFSARAIVAWRATKPSTRPTGLPTCQSRGRGTVRSSAVMNYPACAAVARRSLRGPDGSAGPG